MDGTHHQLSPPKDKDKDLSPSHHAEGGFANAVFEVADSIHEITSRRGRARCKF